MLFQGLEQGTTALDVVANRVQLTPQLGIFGLLAHDLQGLQNGYAGIDHGRKLTTEDHHVPVRDTPFQKSSFEKILGLGLDANIHVPLASHNILGKLQGRSIQITLDCSTASRFGFINKNRHERPPGVTIQKPSMLFQLFNERHT